MYKKLIQDNRGDIKVYFQISSLYEQKRSYKEALEYLNQIEKKTGLTKEVEVGKSRIYGRLGMKKEALGELRMALNGSEEDYLIYGMIAEFYRTHGNRDSAEYYYRMVVKGHMDDSNLAFSYGEFLLEQKRMNEARILYGKIFENERVDINLKYNYLYNAIQDQNFFNRVRPVLDTVVEILIKNYPEDFRIMSLYSDVNYRMSNYNAASGMLKKIMKKDENNFTAWEQLLFCESAMEKPDSVIYYGELAISKFEERPLPYLLVSSVYYSNKEYKKAIDLLEKGEAYADKDALKIEFYSLLAECYGKTDNSEKSDECYQNALVIDSLNVAILNNYAYSLAVRGLQIKKADYMSKYTITREPSNATYLDTYAWVLYKEKKYKEAYWYIKKAVLKGGNRNAEVMGHYGDILLARKKRKKALVIYQEAFSFAETELKNELKEKIKNLSDGL
jgi:Tfp pilus assembly protein PilF